MARADRRPSSFRGRLLASGGCAAIGIERGVAALDPVEVTSLMTAYWRACAARRRCPLIRDDPAVAACRRFLSPSAEARFRASSLLPLLVDLVAVRTRLTDDRLLRWSRGRDEAQVVCLGSGLDSRPYRLRLGPRTTAWFVDRARVNALAARAFERLPAHCALIRIDGEIVPPRRLSRALVRAGLDLARPLFWIVEGVLEYLPPRRGHALLRALVRWSAPGSVVCVHVLRPGLAEAARAAREVTFPWRSLPAFDAVVAALAPSDVVCVSAAGLGGRYRPVDQVLGVLVASIRPRDQRSRGSGAPAAPERFRRTQPARRAST